MAALPSFIRTHFRFLFWGSLIFLFLLLGTQYILRHQDQILFVSSSELPKKVSLGEKAYALERALTNEERALGLGGRENLCRDCGMLFVFSEPALPGFWMKDMRFPLDIVWLLDDTVVHIERNVPFDSPDTFYPKNMANRVLEFNAGETKEITPGERLQFLYK